MKNLIEVDQLSYILNQSNWIIVDARYGPNAFENYKKEHLPGAIYMDLDTDLAEVNDPAKGGRHPLPQVANFMETLAQKGIDSSKKLVVYDDKNGALAATRFWWMMRAIGHTEIYVLNGGLQAAHNANLPLEQGVVTLPKVRRQNSANNWRLPTVSMNEVAHKIKCGAPIIDVREAKRYQGDEEPIDLIAGHIPGAINIPFSENLNEDGTFKSDQELRELYQNLPENSLVTVHCGSGVTACHTAFAMHLGGYEIPELYVGSWSEWSRNKNEMITK